jgi:hypothetical protein
MGKLLCNCGNILSNCMCPNETEGVLIRDIDMEFDDDRNCLQIARMGRDVWECEKCGRLAISYPKRNDCHVKWYLPEDGKPGGLMRFREVSGESPNAMAQTPPESTPTNLKP